MSSSILGGSVPLGPDCDNAICGGGGTFAALSVDLGLGPLANRRKIDAGAVGSVNSRVTVCTGAVHAQHRTPDGASGNRTTNIDRFVAVAPRNAGVSVRNANAAYCLEGSGSIVNVLSNARPARLCDRTHLFARSPRLVTSLSIVQRSMHQQKQVCCLSES